MTVKEIVRLSAIYLNKENVVRYIDDGVDNDALSAVNTLTVCANIIINEIATSFVPMTTREQVEIKNGRVYFSDLSQTPLEIIGVYDNSGDKLSFKSDGESIKIAATATCIEYKYLPPNYGLTDKIGFKDTDVSLRLMAYGTVAEYSLIERAFEESVTWRNRYVDALSAISLPQNKTVRARSFV